MKTYPSRVFASVVGGMILGSSPVVFTVERLLLLKSRIQFGFIYSQKRLNNLKDGKLKETFSSEELRTIISPEVESNSYYMRTGEHGIGQIFWLQQLAGVDNLGHGGIVYLKVSSFWRPKRI